MNPDIETVARYTAKSEAEARAIYRAIAEYHAYYFAARDHKDSGTENDRDRMHIAMGRYMLAADLARETGATADIDLVTRRGLSRMLIEWDGGHALWASSPATFDEARAVGVDHLYDPEWTRLFDVKDPTDGPYPY